MDKCFLYRLYDNFFSEFHQIGKDKGQMNMKVVLMFARELLGCFYLESHGTCEILLQLFHIIILYSHMPHQSIVSVTYHSRALQSEFAGDVE